MTDHARPDSRLAYGRVSLVLVIVLLVIGAILLPAGLIARDARTQVSNTDAFVAMMGPLASDPKVQAAVSEIATDAIMAKISESGLVDRLAGQLNVADRGESAQRGAARARAAAQTALAARVQSAVEAMVQSRQFAALWETSLRLTHRQVVTALDQEHSGVIAVDSSGRLTIELGPIVAELRTRLANAGLTAVTELQVSNTSIVVTESPAIASVHRGYGALMTVGTWLVWVAVLFLLAALVLFAARAPQVSRASGWGSMNHLLKPLAVVAGVTAAFLALTLLVLRLARSWAVGSVSQPETAGVLVGQVFDAVRSLLAQHLVLALVASGGLATVSIVALIILRVRHSTGALRSAGTVAAPNAPTETTSLMPAATKRTTTPTGQPVPTREGGRVVVLISGAGSNLAALLAAQRDVAYPASIVAVVTDNPAAGGLELARREGIATAVVAPADFADRAAWDSAIATTVDTFHPDLVVSAGFMRILGEAFLAKFGGRTINTHPALLPSFPGAHGVRDALAYGVRVTGCTLHLVDAGVDTGPIIAQRAVDVLDGDTEITLHERIKTVERTLLVEWVANLVRDGWSVDDGQVALGR